MSHEKGIEAAARVYGTTLYEHSRLGHGDAWAARAIIAAYLAEAQPTSDVCDSPYCGCRAEPTSEGEERVAFEAWARRDDVHLMLDRNKEGNYHYWRTHTAYAAWQARSSREGGKR